MRIKKYRTKYHRYIFQFDYAPFIVEEVKQIQASLPNTWKDLSFNKDEEGLNTGWVFSSFIVFQQLCEAFDPLVDDDVNEIMEKIKDKEEEEEKRLVRLSKLPKIDDLNKNLSVPTSKPLFPFQRQTVDFIEKAGGRALLGLDMGVGKTCCAIGYGVYKHYGKVLVICPASVKEHWKREIKAFAEINANILTETEERGGWEIIGYPNLDKYWKYISKEKYQLVIIDEVHYIKNKKAIRTKKTLNILKKAKDVLFLSGTPILNRPAEIYNVFNFIRPMPFWTSNGFAVRYCGLKQDPYGNWDYSGATNLDELKEKMSFMIRMKKEEVLDQLPDKTVSVLETSMKSWKDYNLIIKDYRKWLKSRKLSERAIFAEALTKANYLKQVVVENKNVTGIIDDFLENGKKLIVFSQYRVIVDRLHAIYADKSVKLTGGTSSNVRQDIIDNFQNKKAIRVFFSTIKAGGVGITLTSADTVLFTDLDWTPATHQQAEDRAFRIGQKNNVNVYYLITPKTIEEKIWKMLKRKEVMINKIMEGEQARKVHIKTLLSNL